MALQNAEHAFTAVACVRTRPEGSEKQDTSECYLRTVSKPNRIVTIFH